MLEPTGPADCETLAETVRVHGVGAAERRLSHRTLAFHGKDFGAAPRQGGTADWAVRQPAPAPKPAPKPQPRFVRPEPQPEPKRDDLGEFREKVRAELARLPHGPEHRAAAELFAEVDAALAAGRFDRARHLLARAFAFLREERAETGKEAKQEDAARYAAYGEPGAWGEGREARDETFSDESGRSWFTDPGRTDGYARAWASDDDQTGERRAATSHALATVLDDLCGAGRGPVICDRLHDETAAAIRPGTLTALTAADPAASLAMVCDRVADALERCDHAPLTVILRDATPGAFAAMLIAHLTARLNGGYGLTAGEVDARLAGRDADHHYTAKPWLADEAADRLRTHGDRLRVVDAPRGGVRPGAPHADPQRFGARGRLPSRRLAVESKRGELRRRAVRRRDRRRAVPLGGVCRRRRLLGPRRDRPADPGDARRPHLARRRQPWRLGEALPPPRTAPPRRPAGEPPPEGLPRPGGRMDRPRGGVKAKSSESRDRQGARGRPIAGPAPRFLTVAALAWLVLGPGSGWDFLASGAGPSPDLITCPAETSLPFSRRPSMHAESLL